MTNLQFTQINNDSQIIAAGLDEFAASFGHDVPRMFPLWMAHIDGKLVSYCHLHPQMVMYPAISPQISPRNFYRLTWTWNSKIKSEYGDPLIVLPSSWKLDLPMLEKVGVKPFSKGDVYEVIE